MAADAKSSKVGKYDKREVGIEDETEKAWKK